MADNFLDYLFGSGWQSQLPPDVVYYMQTAPSMSDSGQGGPWFNTPSLSPSPYRWPQPYAGETTEGKSAIPDSKWSSPFTNNPYSGDAPYWPRNEQDIFGQLMPPRPRGLVKQPNGSWAPAIPQAPPPGTGDIMQWLYGSEGLMPP